MSKIILFTISLFLSGSGWGQNIYGLSVKTIEGNSKPLSVYQGKKILIITLPTQQNSSSDSLLRSLDSLSIKYANTLVIIAAPSYEDGYTQSNKNTLKQWYRNILNPSIIITDGLYSRKTTGNQQATLFRWLTDKDENGHFNNDVTGPGNKFIVWTDGELVAVLEADTRLGGPTINNILQAQ